MQATQECSIDGCERAGQMRRGMCRQHYDRRRNQGMLEPLPSPAERLAAGLVRMPNGCLEWTGDTNAGGYGVIRVDGKQPLTHRFAWELTHGPIPPGIRVLHHCDNPPCCDAEKCLFLGTDADNVGDMMAKGRGRQGEFQRAITHCPDGHLYDDANTRVGRDGRRHCRKCGCASQARYLARKRAS